ncbi:low-density lipoprotein receptor-related protein 2 [Galendromus occidentalis]|uniref:Low-density lipoprotein receptor-related protein 2 n=1 Tax=Galendromus occidentalis TaxID=34638 RepID=A0AAJ6QWG1_9ACAR|nr:low-density lipoprotein receptor-related protein 2 [Galendromus occidentalis]
MKYLLLALCFALARGQSAQPKYCIGGAENFFQCANETTFRCLNRRLICNGEQDCSDNWDEANCACVRNRDCPRGVKCQKDRRSATSVCVNCAPGQRFRNSQCEDIDECTENPEVDVCAGKGACVDRANGFECVACPKGYGASLRDPRLFTANAVYNESETFRKLLLCADYDECEEHNPCSGGACFNRVGSYSCECPLNHERRLDIREDVCQAIGEQPLVAIDNGTSIHIFELRSATQTQEFECTDQIVDLSADNGLVIFATRRQVWEYRIAVGAKLILADFGNDEDFSNGDIRKISADWENHRVYVLTGDSVSVIDIVGRAVKIIEHRGNISSIAVDPLAGYLFHSEFGRVRRSHLDGSIESTNIIFTALPADDLPDIEVLAVDPNLKYVYYIHNRVLYSFDYDGQRAVIMTGSADYTRLEPFEDLLYATYRVANSDSIVTIGRTGYSVGAQRESTVQSFKGTSPKSIAIIQSAKFPTRPEPMNSCLRKPCSSDWCFPSPLSRSPSHLCDCAAGERSNCLPLKTFRLRPASNDILPNEEKSAVRGASVPITAEMTKVGFIIPIVLVFLNSGLD